METMYDFNYCYDVEDEWKSPKRTLATCGDCEDFAILFRQRLLDQGISADRINLVSGRLDGGFKFDDEYTQRSFSRKFTEVSDERHMVLQVDGYYYDQNGFHWDFPELEDKMFEKMKSFLHDGIYYRNPVREYEPRATEYNRAD